MNKKLFLRLTGGLGNQLYIVATGLALSEIFKMKVEFDITAFERYKLHKLSVNKILPDIILNNQIIKIKNYPLLSERLKPIYYLNEKSPSFDKNIFRKLKSRNTLYDIYLNGYFQSLSYFSLILPKLKIEINKSLGNINKSTISEKKINLEKTICYHIRRKDKLSTINKNIYGDLKINNHAEIIEKICKNLDKENLLILGDDLEYNNALTKTLNISQEIITANDVNKINCQFLDFYLMINSSCLILSNSSFSLWAGYLSNAKTIFYPKPLFPYPRHHSVSKLTYEDLIMPIWNQYDSFL